MFRRPEDPSRRPLRNELVAGERAKEFAKVLRRELSPPERLLWSRLKAGQLQGLKFRKQHPLGPWIADFYCHEAGLVVEIDGPSHRGERREMDDLRDRWMTERDLGVLRVTGREVFANVEGVLGTILRRARERVGLLSAGSNQAGAASEALRVRSGGVGAERASAFTAPPPPASRTRPPPPLGAGEEGA